MHICRSNHKNLSLYEHSFCNAHAMIGMGWKVLSESIKGAVSPRRFAFAMKLLGVSPQDEQSYLENGEIFKKVFHGETRFSSSPRDSGIFYLLDSQSDEKVGVFKIGRKRAASELSARKLLTRLGLSAQAISGVFCAIKSPNLKHSEPIVEDLWNGNVKVYLDNKKRSVPSKVVGILEPYLCGSASGDLLAYALTVVASLAIGLRDGKRDGLSRNFRLIDFEDNMPARLDPNGDAINVSSAATHLPFLEEPFSFSYLTESQMEILVKLTQKWDLEQIRAHLQKEKLCYQDHIAEEAECGQRLVDEGNAHVEIEDQPLNPLYEQNRQSGRLYSDSQIAACLLRLERLKTCLARAYEDNCTLRPLDLVFAVDPFFHAQWHMAEKMKANCDHLSQKVKQAWHGFSNERIFEVIGLYSPSASGMSFSKPDDFCHDVCSYGKKQEISQLVAAIS